MTFYFVMDRDELRALLANARWFTCYWVRSKEVSPGRFRVRTNYAWIQGTA
jgi:hypothetical protein